MRFPEEARTMSRASILPLTLTLVLLAGPAPAADPAGTPASVQAEARAAGEPDAAAAPAPASVYGPIASKDPAVRAEVKRLYLERARVHDDTRARLAELAAEHAAQSDPDFRWEISREIAQLKQDLEIRSVELGLEIARLNEDAPRVTEFELALDQLRNPDKYRPAPADPSVQAERIRAMEQGAAAPRVAAPRAMDPANGGAR
jgi:hypothetical protein